MGISNFYKETSWVSTFLILCLSGSSADKLLSKKKSCSEFRMFDMFVFVGFLLLCLNYSYFKWEEKTASVEHGNGNDIDGSQEPHGVS